MNHRLSRLLAAGALALAAVVPAVGLAAPASAHDQVVSTSPADGATVGAPARVSVTFSEPLLDVATANRIVVTGPVGPLTGDLTVKSTVMTLAFPSPLPAGAYGVQWRAASSDGHPVSGRFAFTVRASNTTAPPMSTATGPVATATTTAPTSSPATDPASSSSSWGPWLLGALIVAALAAVALIGSAKRRVGRDDEGRRP